MNDRLISRIDELLYKGELKDKIYDLSRETDRYILERLTYFTKALPLMGELEVSNLKEDTFNNLLLETYQELKQAGQIR